MADVILIGASVRALATSARRAGLSPLCVDLFRDADLLAHHPDAIRCPIDEYPRGFVPILEELPPLPVIYTGGLENYPEVIGKIGRRHSICGNTPRVLRHVRNLDRVRQAAEESDLGFPAVITDTAPTGGRWIQKSVRSSAGRGIRFVDDPAIRPAKGTYYQQFVAGTPMSALFFGRPHVHCLFGFTEQLIGCEWLNAKPVWYCGNIGPLNGGKELENALHQFVTAIEFLPNEICGQFGVDFIFADGQAWILEVNPRPTASLELFENALQFPMIRGHIASVEGQHFEFPMILPDTHITGKAVWHTPSPCRAMYHPEGLPPDVYADLPHHGQVFGAHEPFVTIFTKALDRDGVILKLKALAGGIAKRFKLEAN